MRVFLLLLMLACSAAAPAQGLAPAQPKSVAVLSLLGDRLNVVTSQMSTGSRIDRNRREHVALATDELDLATVRGFERAAKALRPELGVVLLRANDNSVHQMQDAVVEGKRELRDLLAAVAPLARRAGATHLVLFIKSRGEAQIQVSDGAVGTGYVDGLGFYVDRWSRLRRTDVGEREVGLLAPFAYFTAVLVELDGLKVVSQESSHQARAFFPARVVGATDPWSYLTAAEKVDTLKQLSGEGIDRVVPRLLQKL